MEWTETERRGHDALRPPALAGRARGRRSARRPAIRKAARSRARRTRRSPRSPTTSGGGSPSTPASPRSWSSSTSSRDDRDGRDSRFAAETAVSLIQPYAPHVAEELWELLGHERLWEAPWPVADPALLEVDTVEVVVQVNGKIRDRLHVAPGMRRGRAGRAGARLRARTRVPERRRGGAHGRGARASSSIS